MIKKSVLELKKLIKNKEVELLIIGNAIYISDTKNGIDYRLGSFFKRPPAEVSDVVPVITTVLKCPVCGKEINKEEHKFCPECGLQLKWGESSDKI